jgi:hypothetical protein
VLVLLDDLYLATSKLHFFVFDGRYEIEEIRYEGLEVHLENQDVLSFAPPPPGPGRMGATPLGTKSSFEV